MLWNYTSFIFLINLATSCLAQDLFFWFFTNNSVTTTLTQCQSYGIKLDNNTNTPDTFGVPPYYMIAFPANGVPTTSRIGTDPGNLSWTVNQHQGASMMLFVMDSNGSPGGVPQTVYTVTDGNSGCLPPPPMVDITLSANVSGTLETCEPVEFQISGGKRPYSISVVQSNANVIHNNTLGDQSGNFTFTNQVDADAQIIVAVNDANGVWGTASKLFNAVASTEFTCSGLVSSPNEISPSTSKSHSQAFNRSAIIVAVVVSASAILLLLVLLFFLRRWWRRRTQAARQPGPALVPETWYSPVPIIERELGMVGRPSASVYNLQPSSPSSKMTEPRKPIVQSSHVAQSGYILNPGSGSEGSSSRTEANNNVQPSSSSVEVKRRLPPGVSPQWIIENENTMVIQHEDAEVASVQEIPPPYNFSGPKTSKQTNT